MTKRSTVFALALLASVLLAASTPARAQAVPGCNPQTGTLDDPKMYLESVISRKLDGGPAADWSDVLERSGIPHGPAAWDDPHSRFYDITQQVGLGGDVRGVAFLPAYTRDELGYNVQQVYLLTDAPGGVCRDDGTVEYGADGIQIPAARRFCRWAYIPKSGPLYAPRPCGTPGSSAPPSSPSTPSQPQLPSTSPAPVQTGLTLETLKAAVMAALAETTPKDSPQVERIYNKWNDQITDIQGEVHKNPIAEFFKDGKTITAIIVGLGTAIAQAKLH